MPLLLLLLLLLHLRATEPVPLLPDQVGCGKQAIPHLEDNKFVVGGRDARPGSWPWQVQVEFDSEERGLRHTCGATLLTDTWVATAAHCVYRRMFPDKFRLGFGSHRRVEADSHQVYAQPEAIVVHPSYDPDSLDYDIALFKLKEPMQFSDHISPACLRTWENDFVEGDDCYVTGWGRTVEGGNVSDVLQQLRVPRISPDDCKALYADYNITERMLCYGYPEGGRDTCQGDSGGPVSCRNPKDGLWYLVGITSWGKGCARPGRPGVYADARYVNRFAGFIRDTMAKYK